ncbi:MAG: hypothetical protein A2V88_13820 [Elusimicrobia bacterium RBG_16_66_12]|nr:MAG: hypothetical protein A2V88_13820 [Elusimicrobia bacterium RBG_16_66_12]
MKLALLVGLVFAALGAQAAPARSIRLTRGPKAEDVLRRFVERDPSLKARFDDAAKREESFLAEVRDSDLRDSVADKSGTEELKLRLSQFPGMKAPQAPVCRSLGDCAVPELALDVADSARLPDSVRRLVRPWMLLQQARGSSVEITPASTGDAVLTLKLKDLDAPPLTLNVSPRLLGGFKVWFDQPLVLASLYGRERDAALTR